jgi:hypothetical protein
MPLGKWEAGSPPASKLSVEILAGHRLRMTFHDAESEGWKPVLLEGSYGITANKFGDFHTTVTVDSLHRKGVSEGGKRVVDRRLAVTRQMGAAIRVGDKLSLTFQFECSRGKDHLQMCLHRSGEDGKPQVTCERFEKDNPRCTGEPLAIPGELINAPPQLAPRPQRK